MIRLKVEGGSFDGERQATVLIDRQRSLFAVRPLRRRRTYVLPLWAVAEMVIWRVVKSEVASKRRTRRR